MEQESSWIPAPFLPQYRTKEETAMRSILDLQVEDKHEARYLRGYPLISRDAVQHPDQLTEEGSIIQLFSSKGKFLGKGYYGEQNKGIGWILTDKQNEKIDQLLFSRKLKAAFEKRSSLFADPETDAFRIFNGEGDGIGGLIIDYYGGYLVIQWYSAGIYSFKREIISAISEQLESRGLYEKKRFDTKGSYMEDNDFVSGEEAPSPLVVKEKGIRYAVHLNDGAMVGIFLDQRNVREAVRHVYAEPDSRVLNTFSYTGAFSVAAALAGAHTTSVDLAKRSRPKTREQFEVNGLDPDQHDIVVMDVFDYFKYAMRKNLLFDMVILDPPSFARSKKRTFSTAKDYPALLEDAIAITKKGGIIIASTNNASFSMDKFKTFIADGFQRAGSTYAIRSQYGLPEDFTTNKSFKEGNYLKVVIIEKQS